MRLVLGKFIIVLLLIGCSQSEYNLSEYKKILDPQIGSASEESINQKIGLPSNCFSINNIETCKYIKNSSGNKVYVIDVKFNSNGIMLSWNAKAVW